jgi:steroid delta-isomerase-like uncharacterized protein
VSKLELLERFYSAYNDHDAAAAAATYRDDGCHHEISQEAERQGRDEIERGLCGFFEAFPDARWEVVTRCVDEKRAAVSYILTGTLSAPLGPFEPEGQELRLRGVHLFELAGGQIARSEDYWDMSTFGRQMRPGGNR